MRVICLLAVGLLTYAQGDPAATVLNQAYEALRAKRYDEAIALFRKGIDAAPERAAPRKDLGYTYLKIGENELARAQFAEAMRLDPSDTHLALEYAFLCHEAGEPAQARRIFDRIRKTGNPTAEQAFQNIDRPLAEGIERWKKAIQIGPDNFSSHFELATLAEQRDELALAAEHYRKAWELLPERRSVLVRLGRTWQALNRAEDANAVLLAASRGADPRAAEAARELLPKRYPFVYEFRRALDWDPSNVELRRELAYLLLRMDRKSEAEEEFRRLTLSGPDDMLSAAQLGFLYLARGEKEMAAPLLQRVLERGDEELANRVRAVLRLPQQLRQRDSAAAPQSIDTRLMAERSLKAGYLRDALRYLQIAHEADPIDFGVMLKLGWTYNLLRDDAHAVRWFDLARKSPDPVVANEAAKAYRNLGPSLARFRTTAWTYPLYSSRWKDLFTYAQIKTELKLPLPVRPYVSLRFIGDVRRQTTQAGQAQGLLPLYLSESAFVGAFGMRTENWKGITAWAEAGSAASYLTGHVLPDYRGGVSFFKALGTALGGESGGFFFDTSNDALFISRFGNDFLVYSQSRFGYTAGWGRLGTQFYWNANVTQDWKREYWANFLESGPGLRVRWANLPPPMYFTVNFLRGAYTLNGGNPGGPNFFDLRAGFWYAISR